MHPDLDGTHAAPAEAPQGLTLMQLCESYVESLRKQEAILDEHARCYALPRGKVGAR
jgi:hypothetical protein